MDEAGLPGFYFYFWHAIWVPKGTPKDVIAKLNDAVVKALADPATRKRLADIGQELYPARDVDAGGARAHSRRPRSTSGGRSSRRPASRCSSVDHRRPAHPSSFGSWKLLPAVQGRHFGILRR